MAQQAVRQILEPIWEPTFSPDSYGFRPQRSAQEAVQRLFGHLEEGYLWVVDADIQNFFGTIDQDLLVDQVAERVSDGTVLRWLREMLRAGVLEDGIQQPTDVGTPQGGVISPLLANIYLDVLDQTMATVPDVQYIRYADDWVVLAKTETAARQALAVAQTVVEASLHLTLHPEKTRVVDVRETSFDFLGFTFFWSKPGESGRPLYGPKAEAVQRFKLRIRQETRRNRPINLAMVIEDLIPVIRGWGQYFTISQNGQYYRLDSWIRERCRAFVAKRWNPESGPRPEMDQSTPPRIRLTFSRRHAPQGHGATSSPLVGATIVGEPDVGKPQVRFDEGTGFVRTPPTPRATGRS